MGTTENMQDRARIILVVIGLIAALTLVARGLIFPESPIPLDRVNGFYVSNRCGSVKFAGGLMRWRGGEVYYTLDADKNGKMHATLASNVVIKPVDKCELETLAIDQPGYATFDISNHPSSVTFFDRSGDGYLLTRER